MSTQPLEIQDGKKVIFFPQKVKTVNVFLLVAEVNVFAPKKITQEHDFLNTPSWWWWTLKKSGETRFFFTGHWLQIRPEAANSAVACY